MTRTGASRFPTYGTGGVCNLWIGQLVQLMIDCSRVDIWLAFHIGWVRGGRFNSRTTPHQGKLVRENEEESHSHKLIINPFATNVNYIVTIRLSLKTIF